MRTLQLGTSLPCSLPFPSAAPPTLCTLSVHHQGLSGPHQQLALGHPRAWGPHQEEERIPREESQVSALRARACEPWAPEEQGVGSGWALAKGVAGGTPKQGLLKLGT